MLEDIKIKLNPYLGCSKNLMEFFVIIGYEEKILNEMGSRIIEEQDENLELTILSSAISDLAYEIFSPDNIIKQVYPDKPKILKAEPENVPTPSDVVFSSCFDSVDGKKKVFYSCYALKFYEKYKCDKVEYYVPKAFLILSQYPYFATFYKICKSIYDIKDNKNKISIPIEILIHCCVNYIPSSIEETIVLQDWNVKITKLTGYPQADFDLCKIFKHVPINEFIKIFLIIFVELDLLIFSPDLVKLNLFMYILYMLNYPLIDSNYYWHIKSISKDEMKNGNDTITTSYVGVNAEFTPNLDFSNFRNNNFAVDLDNKKKIYIHNIKKPNKESEEINKLLKYVNDILKSKKVNSIFLSDYIIALKNKLKRIIKEYNSSQTNLKDNFFFINDKIIEINKEIQETFYDFILNILVVLNKDFELDPSLKMPIKPRNISKKIYSEEENIFLDLCRNTIKYNTYFDLFIKRFEAHEEIKPSLLFSDEFVTLKTKDIKKDIPDHIKYFDIMDQVYFIETKPEVREINYNNLSQEFKTLNEKSLITKFKKEKKGQLFTFDQNIIKLFIFHKKSKESYKELTEKKEIEVKKIDKISIPLIILKHFTQILNKEFYLKSSLVYVFAIGFPLFSLEKGLHFLSKVLIGLSEIQYFQRYYLCIILKSIDNYFSLNLEKEQLPNLILKNIRNYIILINAHLINNQIIPNEEMFIFFKKFCGEGLNENKPNNENQIKDYFIFNIDNEKNFEKTINKDIIQKKENKLNFKFKDINIGCNHLERESTIFLNIHKFFVDFNFNLEMFKIKDFIEIVINIIYFLDDKNIEMKCFLTNLISILKRLETELNEFYKK